MKYSTLACKVMRNKFSKLSSVRPSFFKTDFSVSYKCNSRCSHCLIWKRGRINELTSDEFKKVFSRTNVSWVHLTGGEPFMRKDFKKILSSTQLIKNLIYVDTSTNGILTNKTCSDVNHALKTLRTRFEVGVSIDGTRGVHNTLRGVDSFDNAVNTFLGLRALSEKNRLLGVHVNHTLSDENCRTFKQFLNGLMKKNISPHEISIDVVRQSPFFDNLGKKADSKRLVEAINYFLRLNKKFLGKREFLRRKYLKQLRNYLKNERRRPCFAGFASIYVDAVGSVFPCTYLINKMGDLREEHYDLERVFYSSKFSNWRRNNKDCRACMSGCEGVSSIINSLPESIFF